MARRTSRCALDKDDIYALLNPVVWSVEFRLSRPVPPRADLFRQAASQPGVNLVLNSAWRGGSYSAADLSWGRPNLPMLDTARAAHAPLPLHIPIVLYVDAAELGGSARYSVDLARGLRHRGYRVAALCHSAADVAPMRDELATLGVEVYTAEGWDLSLSGRARRVLEMAAILRRYPGCLLAQIIGNYRSGGPVTLAAVLAGVRTIVRADLQPPMPPVIWRHTVSIKLKDPFIRRIVVGAAENRDSFSKHMHRARGKIDVVHTGIHLQNFEPGHLREVTRASMSFTPDQLVVGTISRLGGDVWRKGINHFIDMAARVAAVHPEAEFVIVGDGGARPSLEQQVAKLGITDRVTFTGWREDAPALLAAMDVFVMPSLYEGGPTTVLEAMAMAKPVVSTRVGMVPEVVADGDTGLIVEPGDVAGLESAVSRLLADEELRNCLAARAREEAVRNFSVVRMVDRYLEVFAAASGWNNRARFPRRMFRPA
jgi:glycosyltransferase involved in cell wall biosynthesis